MNHLPQTNSMYQSMVLLYFLLLTSFCLGQTLSPYNVEILSGGSALKFPFAGGMSAPQFSEIDLDGDGQKDLFVFDRNGNVISTYLNKGSMGTIRYEYAPEYRQLFPPAHTWCLLYDYNGDGIEDLFKAPDALGIAGIEVWKGQRIDGKPSFTKIKNPEFQADVLTYRINGSLTNIYVSIVDLPGIYDLDNDGDTDILTFEPDGSFLYSYINKAVELGFGRDTFIMEFSDRCFGKFLENQFNEQITLSTNGVDCASFFGNRKGDRHTGSTITPLDVDCDGDPDMWLGDVSGEYITFLKNGGTTENPWFTEKDDRWPSADTSLRIQSFPAAFPIDANNDGFPDLVITSNEPNNNQNINNIWLYLHDGEQCDGSYRLVSRNFLVEDMIQVGTGAHPAWMDVNGDGLLDLIVGSSGIAQAGTLRQNRLFLFTNIGSVTEPRFELSDPDFLKLSALTSTYSRLAPCSGDLDGDGDLDLFIGNSNGTIMYFRNDGNKFVLVNTEFQNIFVGPNASPFLYDFDKDGLLDFIIGETNNSLNFYKNKGTATNPIFDEFSDEAPNSENVGKLFDKNNFATQNGSPEIFQSGEFAYVLMGFNSDSLSLFRINSTDPDQAFTLIKKNILPEKIGRRLNPAVADINDDGKLDLVVGNERGGLSFYTTDIILDSPITSLPNEKISEVLVFPNPASDLVQVASIPSGGSFKLFDILGKTVLQQSYQSDFQIDVSEIQAGIYLLLLQGTDHTFKKLLNIIH